MPNIFRINARIRVLYRTHLGYLPELECYAVRAKRSKYLPTVLTKAEVRGILQHVSGVPGLVIKVLYGSGLRLNEGLSLRIKDLDFAQRQILVRDTKGNEDRVTMLPDSLMRPLQQHLQKVRRLHQLDLGQGYGSVYLPFALERKHPMPTEPGSGNLSFLRHLDVGILVVALFVVTISMKAGYRKL